MPLGFTHSRHGTAKKVGYDGLLSIAKWSCWAKFINVKILIKKI